jgi:cytochrome o ubiquinol oxidase operon protein cyoD
MNAHHAHTEHGHDHHDGHEDHDGHDHGSFKSYSIGFILSVILTAIPFWLVMDNVIPKSSTLGVVLLVFAAMQMVVHVIYFLHLNARSESGWNMLAFIFTGTLLFIVMSGSLWVMYHLNHNMMPGMMDTTGEGMRPSDKQHGKDEMQQNMPAMQDMKNMQQ